MAAQQFGKYKPRKQKSKHVPTEVGMDDFLDRLVKLRASDIQEICANPSTEIQKEFEDKIAHRLPTFRTLKTFVTFLRDNKRKYSDKALEEFIITLNDKESEDEPEPEPEPVKGKTKSKTAKKVREDDDDDDEEDNEEFDDEEDEDEDDEEEDEDVLPAVVYKKDVVPSEDRARLENERREITKIESEMNVKKEHLYEANRAHRNGWPTVNPEGIEPQDEEMTEEQLTEAIDKLTAEFAAKRDAIHRSAVLPDRYRENQLSSTARQLTHAEETELNAIKRDRRRFESQLQKASHSVYTKEGLSNIKKFRINVFKNAEWMRDENGVKHIYITGAPDKYFARQTMIKHNGRDWYQANNAFFELMAMSSNMRQDGNTLYISTSSDVVSARVMYMYTNGKFVEQNNAVFDMMQRYFMIRRAPVNVQKNMRVDEHFSSDNKHARALGRSCLAFPGGKEQEEIIALKINGEDRSIKEYFRRIINISVYLEENSVFKQRLDQKWFPGDLTKLSVYDKIDYEELAPYYLELSEYKLELLVWEYFFMCGGKIVRINLVQPKRPHIAHENTDGLKINYPTREGGKLYNVFGILLEHEFSPEFVQKIRRIDAFEMSSEPKVYRKNLWEVVENALDYSEKHRGNIDGWKLD